MARSTDHRQRPQLCLPPRLDVAYSPAPNRSVRPSTHRRIVCTSFAKSTAPAQPGRMACETRHVCGREMANGTCRFVTHTNTCAVPGRARTLLYALFLRGPLGIFTCDSNARQSAPEEAYAFLVRLHRWTAYSPTPQATTAQWGNWTTSVDCAHGRT